MKIIHTKLKDMPSSLLAELGSYRYSVFAKGEGWSIPSRLNTPGQEYDRFDRSDVSWLIAWSARHGICGCTRLMELRHPETDSVTSGVKKGGANGDLFWEMSRFSARMDIDSELPFTILWHAVQLADQAGIHSLFSGVTPMLEKLFTQRQVNYESVMPGVLQSEDNIFAVKIAVSQPNLARKFQGERRFRPEEVLPSLGVSVDWNAAKG